MAISFSTAAGADSGGSQIASQNLTIPAGVLAGDVMLLVVSAFTTVGTPSTITVSSTGTSFTQIGTTQFATNGSGVSVNGSIWQAVASGSDAGKVITAHSTDNAFWSLALAAYTGASTSSHIDVSGPATPVQGTATITCPTKTTGVANDWAVFLCAAGINSGPLVGPAGATSRQNVTSSSGIVTGIFDSAASVGGSGTSIGGGNFSQHGNNSNWWTAFTAGLAPAGAAPPPSGLLMATFP